MEEPIESENESEDKSEIEMEIESVKGIVTIGEITYNEKIELGKSQFTVYQGWFGNKEVAVKRIKVFDHHLETGEDRLKELQSPNIVRLLHVESDNSFRYYALELCYGSMGEQFLPQYKEKFDMISYIMPYEEEVLLQLAEGLDYIHSKNIVHLDIKPDNVLLKIMKDQENKREEVIFKWADFGLSKFVNNDGQFSISATGEIIGTQFWVAPEILMGNASRKPSKPSSSNSLTSNSNLKISIKCDIWSTGCVFFYYLTKGDHPFGDLSDKMESEITVNVKKGNAVNMETFLSRCEHEDDWDKWSSYFELVENMVKQEPDSRITLKDVIKHLKPSTERDSPILACRIPEERKIRIMNRKFHIECTSYNDNKLTQDNYFGFRVEVLRGILGDDAKEVVVKKIYDNDDTSNWNRIDEALLGSLSHDKNHHENVLRLLHAEDHNYYYHIRYFAFELCAGSLDHLFLEDDHPKKYKGPPLPSSDIVLTSLIKGLDYIHSKGYIHIRIKPQNVLISLTQPVVMKWADFGLYDLTIGKIESSNTKKWLAPEINKTTDKSCHGYLIMSDLYTIFKLNSEAGDVWSAGAVFYYYLSEGKHPEHLGVQSVEQFPTYDASNFLNGDDNLFARDVIAQMMAFSPEERIKLVPDAVDQLESNWKSCNNALTRTLTEKEMLKLCSLSEPVKRDVDRLCELFNKDGINLNCASTEGDTPLSLLCSSLKESDEHFRSLSTLLKIMREKNMNYSSVESAVGFEIFQQLKEHLRKKNAFEQTRLHELIYNADFLKKLKESKFYSPDSRPADFDPEWFLKDAVQFFADHLPDCLNAKDSSRKTILHHMCEKKIRNQNLLDIIRLLKREKVDLSAVDDDGSTPLHLMCKHYGRGVSYGHDYMLIDIIQELINDADLNAKTEDDRTSLHYLCEYCTKHADLINIIELFIQSEKAVNLNAIDSDRRTILHLLCENYQNPNLVNIVHLLIEKGIDINLKDSYGRTAAQFLIANDEHDDDIKEKIIQIFIDKGCESAQVCQNLLENPDRTDGQRRDLSFIESRNDEIANEIFSHFHLPPTISENLFPFHYRYRNWRGPVPKLYIQMCILSKENKGDIILDIFKECIFRGYDFTVNHRALIMFIWEFYKEDNVLDILKTLFSKGGLYVHFKYKEERGNTFLHLMCIHYNYYSIKDIIEMLVCVFGADPNTRNYLRRTPLFLICCRDEKIEGISIADVIQKFIEVGSDPKIRDSKKKTTLHALCKHYKGMNISDIVELLIKEGVDVNARTIYKESALDFLCKNYPHEEELFKTVHLFIKNGFDMNVKKLPRWKSMETSILDCLNNNPKIHNKERIAELLLLSNTAGSPR